MNSKNPQKYTRKTKIKAQFQGCKCHMHEELIIFPAFVKLKIFNTQEKYIYHQITFHHFLQQKTIKTWNEQLLRNFFRIFTEYHMFIFQKKVILTQLSYNHILQQTAMKTSYLGIYFHVVSQIFIMQEIYIHYQ